MFIEGDGMEDTTLAGVTRNRKYKIYLTNDVVRACSDLSESCAR
jgi:hypothetical protein